VEGRLCPGCGTRAKAKWEFCPRCGESLVNAPAASSTEAAVSVPEAAVADDYDDAGGSWKGLAGAVAVLAVAMVAFVKLRNPGPPPASAVFQVPNDSPPPATAPPLKKKGAEAFENGRILLTAGDAQGAIPLLAEAVAQDSENALYRHTYGRALWLGNNKEAALAELAAATILNPGSPVYWTELARAQKDLGRTNEALRSFEQATSLFPDNVDALKDYGTLLARLDDRQRAATILKHVADKRPGDAGLQQEMAYALESTGDVASAATLYRRVVDTVPDAPIARSRLAELLIQQKPAFGGGGRAQGRAREDAGPLAPVPQPGQRAGADREHRGSGGRLSPIRRALGGFDGRQGNRTAGGRPRAFPGRPVLISRRTSRFSVS
jgi:tetratricopeptide (TPR) repeat protein